MTKTQVLARLEAEAAQPGPAPLRPAGRTDKEILVEIVRLIDGAVRRGERDR